MIILPHDFNLTIHEDNSFHKQSQQEVNVGEEMKLCANISILYLSCKYWCQLRPLIRWYYLIIIMVQSYTGKYHKLAPICIVKSAWHM